jgi:hypothetical protein
VPNTGSSVYLAFIKEQLAGEDARKDSVEKRGLGVITTSGTLASLLLGLSALETASDDFKLSAAGRDLLVAATLAFALAALASVVTNLPWRYKGVPSSSLQLLVDDKWDDEALAAEQRTAATLVGVVASAKERRTASRPGTSSLR